MTSKEVYESGVVLQGYPIDFDPFTKEDKENGGVENIVIYDNKVYSVFTDMLDNVLDEDNAFVLDENVDHFMEKFFGVSQSSGSVDQ